jgi:hypothetical protein
MNSGATIAVDVRVQRNLGLIQEGVESASKGIRSSSRAVLNSERFVWELAPCAQDGTSCLRNRRSLFSPKDRPQRQQARAIGFLLLRDFPYCFRRLFGIRLADSTSLSLEFRQRLACKPLVGRGLYEIGPPEHLEDFILPHAIAVRRLRHLDWVRSSAMPGQTARHSAAQGQASTVGANDGGS